MRSEEMGQTGLGKQCSSEGTVHHSDDGGNTLEIIKGTEFSLLARNACRPAKVNRCFGIKYRLHLQGRRVGKQETSKKLATIRKRYAHWLLPEYTKIYVQETEVSPHSHLCETLRPKNNNKLLVKVCVELFKDEIQ
jgi:hypothetical protein